MLLLFLPQRLLDMHVGQAKGQRLSHTLLEQRRHVRGARFCRLVQQGEVCSTATHVILMIWIHLYYFVMQKRMDCVHRARLWVDCRPLLCREGHRIDSFFNSSNSHVVHTQQTNRKPISYRADCRSVDFNCHSFCCFTRHCTTSSTWRYLARAPLARSYCAASDRPSVSAPWKCSRRVS